MKVRFLLSLLCFVFMQNIAFAITYEFGWPEPHFSIAHDIYWDGRETEEIYFSIVDAGGPAWINPDGSNGKIPVVTDVIDSIRLQGPAGSGIDTDEISVTAESLYLSIEGYYSAVSDNFVYRSIPSTGISYKAFVQQGISFNHSGEYILTIHCNNAQDLVATQNIASSLNSTILPAPEDVSMTMLNDGTIRVTWSNPISYPANTNLRARIESYDRDVFTGFRVRLRDLPSDREEVIFDKELVDMLRAYGSQFKVKVQAVLSNESAGCTPSYNCANSEKLTYVIENNVLVRKDYQPERSVVVIPLK